jgi:hypothetical protein
MDTGTGLFQITISRAGSVLEQVTVEAGSALEAIDRLDADREKFIVQISDGPDVLLTTLWSGYEYEARLIDPARPANAAR